MVKYIIKRILLSIVILLGVSLIIYTLVRLMPADYMETKFSTQLTQGTMTQEQVDQFKKDAGLYMPDGILTITVVDDSVECNGESFQRDLKSVNYERMLDNNMSADELYCGNYYADEWQITLRQVSDPNNDLKYNQYTLYKRAEEDSKTMSGSYTVSVDGKIIFGEQLKGDVKYVPEEEGNSGHVQFTVKGGDYDGKVFRLEVSQSDHNRAMEGNISFESLYRADWETSDGMYRLTLGKDNKWELLELSGSTRAVLTGDFTVDETTHELTLEGLLTKPIEYRNATFGEKASAVLNGYFQWLFNMMRGNFGRSFTHEKPVTTVISEHMWISFIISFIALIFEFVISIPLGITSATHQYSARDYFVTVVTMIGISFPSFFFAALLIKMFATDPITIFPSGGLVSGGSSATGITLFFDMAWHLVLPMVVMVVLSIGSLMRYTRTNMLEVLSSDYIRTARAKGLSEKRVVYVHAFRNTLIPLMTMMAGILPSLFGGAMITEEVFAIDGIGRIAYKSLTQGDLPLIMGYNMFLAVLTVIGTLLSDIMYAVVDPRVKLTK